MKEILIAVDGSEPSQHAVSFGLEVAKSTGAAVTLVHVVEPFVPPVDSFVVGFGLNVGEVQERLLQNGKEILHRVASEVAKNNPSVAISTQLITAGQAAESIAELADKRKVDLVIVASRGRGAFSRVLLGSTSDRLVHVCHCPVMVVR